jgi:hypothetical protein
MTPSEKAKGLVEKCLVWVDGGFQNNDAKQCALIAVENEYNSLREQLFNLRSCYVIESATTYLTRLENLNKEEKQVKQEINKL